MDIMLLKMIIEGVQNFRTLFSKERGKRRLEDNLLTHKSYNVGPKSFPSGHSMMWSSEPKSQSPLVVKRVKQWTSKSIIV
jgi:hypothetical protein